MDDSSDSFDTSSRAYCPNLLKIGIWIGRIHLEMFPVDLFIILIKFDFPYILKTISYSSKFLLYHFIKNIWLVMLRMRYS